MIIGIAGRMNTGKDTLGEIFTEELTNFKVKAFADKLRAVAEILTGIPAEKFKDSFFKTQALPKEWCWDNDEDDPMYVREFLQEVGTECIREFLHEDAWVNALFADYKLDKEMLEALEGIPYTSENEKTLLPNWVITDVRFPNEAKAIRDRDGLLIKLNRIKAPVNDHKSELALLNWPDYNYVYDNDGDLDDLRAFAKKVIKDNGLDKI
jgi:hypothetical protein